MHNKLPNFFLFVDTFKKEHIRKLDKKIAIIYRNYSTKYEKNIILSIKDICKKDGRKFFLSNNLKLAINLGLDGAYLPSFNKIINTCMLNTKKKFIIIGSAHSVKEIRIKEKQGAKLIFISPLFETNKKREPLGPIKFNFLASKTKIKVIALGGIIPENLNKLRIVKAYGFAGISYFKKNNNIRL